MAKRLSAAPVRQETKTSSTAENLAPNVRCRSLLLLKTILPRVGRAFAGACRTHHSQYSYGPEITQSRVLVTMVHGLRKRVCRESVASALVMQAGHVLTCADSV